jgi:hypothetical protein
MRTVIDLAPKPSDALEAMYIGLKNVKRRRGFKLNMQTFGKKSFLYEKPICFGCAATCALEQLSGKKLLFSKIKKHQLWTHEDLASYYKVDFEKFIKFELALDKARKGSLRELMTIYGFRYHHLLTRSIIDLSNSLYIQESNVEEELPKLKELYTKLREQGY